MVEHRSLMKTGKMNRLVVFWGLVLAIASCERTGAVREVEWCFTAPQTKAALSSNGAFSWNAGDEIAVWTAAASSFVKFTSASGNSIFRANAPANAHFTGTAYFPYSNVADKGSASSAYTLPPSYNAGDGASDTGLIPMCATVVDGSDVLRFQHQCAYLTVQVKNAPATLSRLVVSGDGIALSGDFPLTELSGLKAIQAVSGDESVTLSFSLSAPKSLLQFTIPVPVGTYAVSYTAYEGAGELMTRSTDAVSFSRAHLYKLNPADPQERSSVSLIGCESYTLSEDSQNWNF